MIWQELYYQDDKGRKIVEMTAHSEPSRYRIFFRFQSGNKIMTMDHEIKADSIEHAYEIFEKEMDKQGKKMSLEANKIQIASSHDLRNLRGGGSTRTGRET